MRVKAFIIALGSFIVCAALSAAQQGGAPAAPEGTPPVDPVKLLVGRLDLERFKATIKGLTQFGDRREGTDRNQAAVDWIASRLESYGCAAERHWYVNNPFPPAQPPQVPPAAPPAPQIASGEVRRGQGGSRMRGMTRPTTPNNNPEAQPDAELRALNAQAPSPGEREQVYCTKVGTTRPDGGIL